jgi:CDP-diacylglycerol---glycerol-3-phosphate 3-phosphatidyltransferase
MIDGRRGREDSASAMGTATDTTETEEHRLGDERLSAGPVVALDGGSANHTDPALHLTNSVDPAPVVDPTDGAPVADPTDMVRAVATDDTVQASSAGASGEPSDGERNRAARLLRGVGPGLARRGVKADDVTVLGMLVAGLTGAVIATGHLWIAIFLLTTGGLMDTVDGAVAKAAGTASKRGAFFDSVADRIADMFIFGGLAWYFAAGPGHDPRLAIVPFVILGVSNTISYTRAKAESLGFEARGGLMERAERLIGLGIALLVHTFVPAAFVPLLFVLLALCVVTAVQRFFKVWIKATVQTGEAGATTVAGLAEAASEMWTGLRARRVPRVESRWRAWRLSTAGERPGRVVVTSRTRSRRREEPLSIRLRRAFQTERQTERSAGRLAVRPRAAHAGQARSERRLRGNESALRRRLGPGH